MNGANEQIEWIKEAYKIVYSMWYAILYFGIIHDSRCEFYCIVYN